jgi:hypothetical protein
MSMPTDPAGLIADPLYQVNLVLWMLQPSAAPRIDGILARAGFRLRAIEPDLTLPVGLTGQLKQANIAVRSRVQPDIALDGPDRSLVLLECKATMFGGTAQPGQGDGHIRQARSLLLQIPPVLASALSLQPEDVSDTFVLYLSRHEEGVDQSEGLRGIADALGKAGFATTSFGLCGLRVVDEGVVLCPCATHPPLPPSLSPHLAGSTVLVHRLVGEDDPRPLYFLPWIPGSSSSGDAYGRAVFCSTVLGAAVAVIARAEPPCSVSLVTDDLIRAATRGLYDRWRSRDARKALRSRVKELLRQQIQRAAPEVDLSPMGNPSLGWQLCIENPKVQSRIVEGLARCDHGAWDNTGQITLEDLLDDES